MRLPNQRGRHSVGANMTPMIDVVFLLIIFFLVSSHLARQENRLPLDLPMASSFAPLDPERAPLTISIDRDAKFRVNGNVVDEASLRSILADLRRDRGTGGGDSDSDRRGRSVCDTWSPCFAKPALAGVTDASIAVREESSP